MGRPSTASAASFTASFNEGCAWQVRATSTAQNALQGALSKLVPGAAIADVCEFSDALIDTLCAQAFKTKGAAGKGGAAGGASGTVEEKSKGVAFPTCISVNECLRCGRRRRTEAAGRRGASVRLRQQRVHCAHSFFFPPQPLLAV